jgi:hypothetical protein
MEDRDLKAAVQQIKKKEKRNDGKIDYIPFRIIDNSGFYSSWIKLLL